VCLHCWHFNQQLVLESEGHVLFECPRYAAAQQKYLSEITVDTRTLMGTCGSGELKLIAALGSHSVLDWSALGRFCGNLRTARRKLRHLFEGMSRRLDKVGFTTRKVEWRRAGRHVCRHGVFFKRQPPRGCPCLSTNAATDWSNAVLMPRLDNELKTIVVCKFDADRFQRLGFLHAEARRRAW
jgi:hypothetical protein